MSAPASAPPSVPVVRSTTDAAQFARIAGPVIAADPVRTSVVATNLGRCLRDPGPDDLWIWVEHDAGVVALAMHLPPHGVHLPTDDAASAVAVADHVHGLGREPVSASGWRTPVEAFVERWTGLTGLVGEVAQEQAAHELGVLRPPDGVPGRARAAGPPDAELLEPWADGFAAEADAAPPPRPPAGRLATQLADGGVRVWERTDGTPVSMVYASPAHPPGGGGVSRVSWVFTPPEHRGHGYAAAVVAAVSAERVAEGARCMLYTDLANPTSNGVYRRIGYERVAEALVVRLG